MVDLRSRKTKMNSEESIPFVPRNKVKDSVYSTALLKFSELPKWMEDNNYILSGYRAPTNSYWISIKSLLYIHNETGNVYSHLLGAVLFLVAAIFTTLNVLSQFETTQWADFIVMYIFIAGAIACLCCSTLFHLFHCHSEDVAVLWNRCDYLGIVFLIVGSYFPAIYYAFYCSRVWKTIYLAFIVAFGAATAVMSIAKKFGAPEYRWIRTSLFLAMGLSGLWPFGHAIWANGWAIAVQKLSLKWFGSMGLTYVCGALIYASRVPEKWFPGKFDYIGHSHQIFHVCVVVAAVFHYIGVVKAYRWSHLDENSCSVN
ncbi:hypothetical protein K7432_014799 [Basidiobolus ranarum]|uniref:Uncharacterized protein n=1 Tax=Basidiobolus ranarum TaxID=34480 RepID=A0ABR2VP59_9FUNG